MKSILGILILLTLLCTCNNSLLPENLVMKLERRRGSNLEELKLMDHSRQQKMGYYGANFTLGYLNSGSGLYFTTLKIGSPVREFTFQIDIGTVISWVSCADCHDCERSKNSLQLYSPSNSSSASILSCLEDQCIKSIPTHCDSQHPRCTYRLRYLDRSITMGFLVSDIIHFDMVDRFSTSVVFGCSNRESGLSKMWADGILGFSPRSLSLISQLSLPVFSHCLRGGDDGGGILIFGRIASPIVVYTKLDTFWGDYQVNLESIAVNGNIVDIDPSAFFSDDGFTVVDASTALTYLAGDAYDSVINAITTIVSKVAEPTTLNSLCYKVSKRIDDIFPSVTFNFEGGASMIVKPKDYLFRDADLDGARSWCIGFLKSTGENVHRTILGDLVLRNKIVIYDIAHERLGWASHDCSKPFNISKNSNARSSCVDELLLAINFLSLFLYLFMFD